MSSRLIDVDDFRKRMYHEVFDKGTDMCKWDSGLWIRYKLFEKLLEEQPTINIDQKIVKNSLYGEMHIKKIIEALPDLETHKKNFIEALPDLEKILDITSEFDIVTLMALISTLIDTTAAQAGVDPGELAHTILETVVAVNDEDGYIFKEVKE